MTDRPILFSAPMVAALRAGTKTQTRRILKLPTKGEYHRPDMGGWAASTVGGGGAFLRDGSPCPEEPCVWNQTTGTCIVPSIKRGDRLWVRESYFQRGHWSPVDGAQTKGGRQKWAFVPDSDEIRFDEPSAYRRGRHADDPATVIWHKRLGRFMPRAASRMTLVVTDVRVGRLLDISEADALAEGAYVAKASGRVADNYLMMAVAGIWFATGRAWYANLWGRINGEGSWAANPWVVAYSFTVERRNIDAEG